MDWYEAEIEAKKLKEDSIKYEDKNKYIDRKLINYNPTERLMMKYFLI